MKTSRPRAAVVYDPSNITVDRWRRRGDLIDSAIIHAALNLHTETEKLVPPGQHATAVWNSRADMIDAKFGSGFLGVRIEIINAFSYRFRLDRPDNGRTWRVPNGIWRAIGLLDDLAAHPLIFWEAQPEIFAWMADLLFMSVIPEGLILLHAGPRNSIWDRRLRKRKSVQALRAAIAHAENLADLEEDQRRQRARIYRTDLLRRHYDLERLIRLGRRLDSDLKEVAAGWLHGWRIKGYGDLGMLVPLSWEMAQGAPEVPETDDDEEDDPATE